MLRDCQFSMAGNELGNVQMGRRPVHHVTVIVWYLPKLAKLAAKEIIVQQPGMQLQQPISSLLALLQVQSGRAVRA